LLTHTLGWGQVYSLIMCASGTLSPPIKTQGGYVLAALTLMGALGSFSNGNPGQPWLVKTCFGMIGAGVATRVVVAFTRTYNVFFSNAYFVQFSSTLMSVGAWMLAAASNPPELYNTGRNTTPSGNSTVNETTYRLLDRHC